ncbi:MAG TPA: plastocyanin/azurin family copper-binding protein, partial [Roseiflexaceae bacterium]|nr:plastocyanin/azurin family copper-binding protein [Roseiflexaceae bacterium]
EVTFKAPAPGTYTFLCTYPGHYAAGMKGTLTVEP